MARAHDVAGVRPVRERLRILAEQLAETANALHGVELVLVGQPPSSGTDSNNVSPSQGEVHDLLGAIEGLTSQLWRQAAAIASRL